MESEEMLDEQERQEFVQALIRRDALSGPALGVAKQYVAEGRRPLSDKQQRVLADHVFEAHRVKICTRCSSDIPWSEQAAALDNGGMCGYCQHQWDKVMKDD